jgi:DNA topoisomerase-6 subunit A
MLLLRYEIKAHLTKAPTPKTKDFLYSLQITERHSLNRFREWIGFSHPEKRRRLDNLIATLRGKQQRPNRPPFPPVVRRLIRRRLRERGLSIPSKFYGDDRGVSMQLLEEAIFMLGRDPDLEKLRHSDLMWSKIRELRISENQPSEVWDITVPGPESFIANGIITHNCGGMFTRFVEDGVNETHNAILIHTGGQAPRSARRIIRRLRYELNLPTYLFVDGDPWGCHISQVIISGSAQAAHLRGLATPDAIWLGVWASDIQKYKLPSDALTDTDRKRTQELLRDPRYQSQFWQKELKLFLEHGRKAEQQSFSRFGLSYVTKEYLPAKFAEIQRLKRQGIL